MENTKSNFSLKNALDVNSWPYWLSFFIPAIAFFSYFAAKNFNVLTVDLGQQYLDFLAFYQKNLLMHPLRFIYTFSNGLGGSFLGTTAYYLLSPFNLLLLLFPQRYIPVGILIVITMKVGTIGLSSYYAWHRKFSISEEYILAASSAYALCGYVVANNLNLMWLDSLILLPLLINEIDHILHGEKHHLVLITFLIWVTNFYTGYMDLLFGAIYLISQLFLIKKGTRLKAFLTYFKSSVWGSFLDAFILFPTIVELLQGKSQTSVKWTFNWQFTPIKILGKLADGSYSFDEMSSGMPNIFITCMLLLLALIYFLDFKVNWKEKLVHGLVFLFMLLSLDFTPLVLIWHMGQFPVWYPGRFSFILSFYCIGLALRCLETQDKFNIWQKILSVLLAVGLVVYIVYNPQHLAFINKNDVRVTTIFVLAAAIYICLIYGYEAFSPYIMLLLVVAEMGINLVFSLNAISYQQNSNYAKFETNINQTVKFLTQKDTNLYRTEKSFSRSDDDSFSGNYYGASVFNSISNHKVAQFMTNLGYIHNSNSFANHGGTLITDSVLGIKYYIEPNYADSSVKDSQRMPYDALTHRLDLNKYSVFQGFSQLAILKNSNALPFIFTSKSTKDIKFLDNDPIENQERVLANLTNKKDATYFEDIGIPYYVYSNLKRDKNNQLFFTKQDSDKAATVVIHFTPKTNDAYYLQLPNGYDFGNAGIFVNDTFYDFGARDGQTRLVSVASGQKGKKIKITFSMNRDTLDLSGTTIWRMKDKKVANSLKSLKKPNLKLHQPNSLTIVSQKFNTKKSKRFVSTIPSSSNWLVFDNGHLLHKKEFAGAFIAFDLSKGQHKLTLIYIPWIFLFSILVSLITLFLYNLFKNKQRKNSTTELIQNN